MCLYSHMHIYRNTTCIKVPNRLLHIHVTPNTQTSTFSTFWANISTLAQSHLPWLDFPILPKYYYCVVFMLFLVFPTHHPLHHLSAISKCCVLPLLLPFWEGVRKGRKKTIAQWKEVQPIQQISITWYAWNSRNWHVAVGQQCIALVRCPWCNKMQ